MATLSTVSKMPEEDCGIYNGMKGMKYFSMEHFSYYSYVTCVSERKEKRETDRCMGHNEPPASL